jgi:hypothetical protein
MKAMRLTEADVSTLESRTQKNPGDVEARFILAYSARRRAVDDEHYFWLIENEPLLLAESDHPFLPCSPHMRPLGPFAHLDRYALEKELWERALAREPSSVPLRIALVRAMLGHEPAEAEALLRRWCDASDATEQMLLGAARVFDLYIMFAAASARGPASARKVDAAILYVRAALLATPERRDIHLFTARQLFSQSKDARFKVLRMANRAAKDERVDGETRERNVRNILLHAVESADVPSGEEALAALERQLLTR